MKTMVTEFNTTLETEDIFRPTIANQSLHENREGNGDRVVNFATTKNSVVKSTMFAHRDSLKFALTSPDVDSNATDEMPFLLWLFGL
jgi:hypothetical protein